MATPEALREARQRKRDRYPLRTQHKDDQGEPLYTNRLILEDSPYLLQHAHNPVDWRPWDSQSFVKAAQEDKPVFLSIGYSTCHWCHVMEDESFDDKEVAELLNRYFVPIKVDREQRPDLDSIYMTGVQLITGHGGWPLSCFLTPDGMPFFGGTYYPKDHFMGLLGQVQEIWHDNRERLLEDASTLDAAIRRQLTTTVTAELPEGLVDEAVASLLEQTDTEYGGFGDAPKFPHEPNLFLLLEESRRDMHPLAQQTSWQVISQALDGMLRGGIYDQVGGGFHRYATDRAWQIPHFEKMLYNQGQLASVYLQAWQLSGHAEYRRVAEETLDYVLREMRSPRGGFYSATDADSEGLEGKFFVWDYAELAHELDSEALALCKAVYGITRAGNFEGTNVLHLPYPLDTVADTLGMSRNALDEALADIKRRLYAVRAQRTPPLCDRKQITEWNGMVIAALAQAALVLERDDYRQAAVAAAEDLWRNHHDENEGRLWRTSLDGVASIKAQLEDYAHFLHALIGVYDMTQDEQWLERTFVLLDELDAYHGDSQRGGYYISPLDSVGPQPVRSKQLMDGATVAGNSLLLPVLVALYRRSGDVQLRTRIERQIEAFSGRVVQAPLASPVFLQGLRQWESPAPEPLQYLAGGAIRADCRIVESSDTQLQVVLRLDMAPGWHIQQHDLQRPESTRLSVVNRDDWQDVELHYPTPERVNSEDEGYTGRLDIDLTARERSANPLILELQVQPCNATACLPVERCRFVVHWVHGNVPV
ncbi:DUF255 domain-containing protein [Halomonas sp. McH1-25]|uniref:DUF255 domain-containing protein n=1 Tax=unclassified Halomonas TaxID=2609666 RepID=UPI001EF3F699|nr:MULTISPECIES: DUF255 domain-containing protein [unclassified Halomonas]MCG7600766.1 DUF255 domain-containing protein [Halomonas sp. McH1-25]MCP1342731.1 DUF255 domain-containing protein [Halomonas sp. FL8]MCP1361036.1 DUF255 domain-containing protein [Halomonas sp. BBD45]MCP1364772.1 DUF255 domain-containing protein [Halomonas sp. BBD48]